MTGNHNPFIRGFGMLRVERTLIIDAETNGPLVYVRLHESQSNLSDANVLFHPCVFNGSFALVVDGETPDKKLRNDCLDRGHVRGVVHAIFHERDGSEALVGYSPSHLHLASVMKHLTFQTGHYSRTWEISSAHITQHALDYLAELADIATPTRFLFIAFRIPYSPAIGVRLMATPWTDANLRQIEGVIADELRKEHLGKGMPEHLADILHLAARADTRVLIFDAAAPVLDGLPIFANSIG
ncbi:ABC transporter substrate-binding protein [Brucella anthropi]|uniref:DUF5983 family protein n=1 Tax=Brucella anthropi TaxID=529 RepID=UPI00044595EA|nr:hypothetical protein [Brucella anthropi]EXL06473.1 ABC transporter substrate-binding protein [Brucella anthropi]